VASHHGRNCERIPEGTREAIQMANMDSAMALNPR
jgi:hypothetical protein